MRAKPTVSLLLSSGALLAIQACATPAPVVYGPMGPKSAFGYRDSPNPEGGHTVLVALPPQVSLTEARAFWDRRADELCPGGVAKRIVFRSERKEFMSHAPYVQYGAGVSSRLPTSYELEGYVYCRTPTKGG